MRNSAILLILTSILLFLAFPAWGQGYTFTKVVDLSTQRTDGNGLFAINSATTPAFDGHRVVLRDNGNRTTAACKPSGLSTPRTAKLTKLVDLHTVRTLAGPRPSTNSIFRTRRRQCATARWFFWPAARSAAAFWKASMPCRRPVERWLRLPTTPRPIRSGGKFSSIRFVAATDRRVWFRRDNRRVSRSGNHSFRVGIYAANADGSSVDLTKGGWPASLRRANGGERKYVQRAGGQRRQRGDGGHGMVHPSKAGTT